MPAASRSRPAGAVVLHSFASHVRARPKNVFDALDARFRPDSDSETLYFADSAAFLIVEQAGRWYRGEYRVVPDQDGSHIEYTMLNLTPDRWLSRLTARRIVADAPAQFERLARQLRLELE
jgi:hypothetical protein